MRLPEASHSAIGLLRVLLAASLLLPLALFLLASWLNYHSAVEDAQRDLRRTMEVAREQAARVFDGQNQVVDRVSDLVRGMDVAAIRASERQLHETFAGIVARQPQVQSVLLVARDGRPLVSAGTYPVPSQVDVSGRDYFRAVMEGYPGPFVSSLQIGDVNRQMFFGVSRPWLRLDGTLAGVIDVAVSPAFFRDFYQVVLGERGPEGHGSVVTLVRDDGQVLVRFPDFAGQPPQVVANSPFFQAVRRHPDSGTYQGVSIVDADAPNRLFVYGKVQDFPLYVVAGRSMSAIAADWRRTVGSHLVFGLPATLALVAVAWTALVRARREQEALAQAQREIRRRETAEQALLRSQRLEAVGQMTGGIAHDFNNLLTVILGSAELLTKRSDDPARVRRIAEQITLAARRGGDVTQQLLAFSRRQFVNPEVIDLDVRLHAFEELLNRAASQAVKLTLDLDGQLDPVRLDPGQFEAAILNLVGNARDAMPGGGRIRIMTRNIQLGRSDHQELAPGAYIQVCVSDTGTGMDAQTAAKAFEPFFTTKEVGKGTGLGLSQVYGFVKQAGGDVRIDTAPGKGTTVEILLPRALARSDAMAGAALPGTPHQDAEPPPPREAGKGEVVLAVEDEDSVRETVGETLRDLGYRVLTAATAEHALSCLRSEERIDLLFSDVMMPGGMNGMELSQEARRLRPALKILLTSGYNSVIVPGVQHTFPLLPKPYDRGQLASRLRTVLGG